MCLNLILQTALGDDMYVFTRLNKVYDAMPATQSHSNKLFPRPPTPFDGLYLLLSLLLSLAVCASLWVLFYAGPVMATSAPASTPPHVLEMGVFATASFANLKMRKEQELAEIIFYTLPKIPKAYSKEYITER